jgi:hypothetical protein
VACSVRDIVVGLWHRAMRPTRLRKNGIYDCQLPTWREAFESPAIQLAPWTTLQLVTS